MNEDIYAFWARDRFPYWLGGKVERFEKNGTKAYIASYQRSFKHAFLLAGDEGKVLLEELNSLRCERERELKDLEVKFKDRLDGLVLTYVPSRRPIWK